MKKKAAVPPRSVARRLAAQAAPLPAPAPRHPSPEFSQDLLYYWCEGPEWNEMKMGSVAMLLRQWSERHGTFVVPGRQAFDFAVMGKAHHKDTPSGALARALAAGLLKPLQGP